VLSENIKTSRRSIGLSQEELAIKLNVVRQTVSKWERGLSVPDSEMLISLSEVLETPVSLLLGEKISESEVDDLKAISEKLEVINLQLARREKSRMRVVRWLLVLSCLAVVATFIGLLMMDGSYLDWDYGNPETAVAGVLVHGFEWVFVRILPFVLIGLLAGMFRMRRQWK